MSYGVEKFDIYTAKEGNVRWTPSIVIHSLSVSPFSKSLVFWKNIWISVINSLQHSY